MSSKSEEDQVIVNKLRNYPDLTLDASVTKPSQTSPINTTVSTSVSVSAVKQTSHSISIGSSSGAQNYTDCSELKLAIFEKRVPPYVNVSRNNRSTKSSFTKLLPKPVTKDKTCVTQICDAASQSLNNNKSVSADTRTNINSFLLGQRATNEISFVPKSDKVSSSMATNEDSNSTSPKSKVEQGTQSCANKNQTMPCTSEVLEKNISKNVITMTPCSTSPVKSTLSTSAAKEANPCITTNTKAASSSVPFTRSVSSAKEKSISKMISSRTESTKSDTAAVSPNNNAKSVVINTGDLAGRILMKPTNAENAKGSAIKAKETIHVAPKKMEVVGETSSPKPKEITVNIPKKKEITTYLTSNTEILTKNTETAKSIPMKFSQQSCFSKINPKTTTISVINNAQTKCSTLGDSIQMQAVSNTSFLSDNKNIMEELNKRSNVNLTPSVSVTAVQLPSSCVLLQSVSDPKIRNINNETMQAFIKPINNPNVVSISAGNPRNRNGNGFEVGGSGNPNSLVGNSNSTSPNNDSSPSSSNDMRSSKRDLFSTEEKEESESSPARRKIDEPECLTISSDEEETEEAEQLLSSSDTSDVRESLLNKEPLIEKDDDVNRSTIDSDFDENDSENKLNVISGSGYTNVACRTVRIGSYKFTPRSNVTLSPYGIRIVVPAINKASESVILKIPIHEIVKVLIHFEEPLPVIFFYVSAQMGAKVRSILNMTENSDIYFDPNSNDESQRRITLLPKQLKQSISMVTESYLDREILAELNLQEANELLVRSAPKEVRRNALGPKTIKQVPLNPVQTIMVFPPPPAKGGISINTEDYSCLAEDVFLNDVIIDFYLKYLYNQRLSEEDKQKTHIFSSFFYKRLTDKATPMPKHLQNSRSGENTITPAEIRHSRVKNWTKNIDLFSKDYIVIPLNENQHWFLAIICFPGLKGPVSMKTNKPVEVQNNEVKTENAAENASSIDEGTITIGSTTITPLRLEAVPKFAIVDEDGDAEDRDEADGADEDVNFSISEESDAEYSEPEQAVNEDVKPKIDRKKPEREPIKQPCILIFDSLSGASRARIIATLRDYLRIEYKVKHKEDRDFSKCVVKGACPKVPQQNNYTDCGLFVLQYVETFFEKKISDYHLPIKTLRNWFDPDSVGHKRLHIQQLLIQLMREQNIDIESLNLPDLNLSSSPDTDSMYSDDDFPDDEYYDQEEGGIEHFVYDDEVDIEDMDQRHLLYPEEYCEDSEDAEFLGDEVCESRFHVYDDIDEDEADMHADSEENSEDELYKDLDENEPKTRKYCKSRCRRATKEYAEGAITEDDDEADDEEQVLINERLRSMSKEDVTITQTMASSVSTRNRTSCTVPNEAAKAKTPSPARNTRAILRAARPFGDVDSSDNGCSSNKKFRPN